MVSFTVIVVSDRVYGGYENDVSGELAVELIRRKGFTVNGKIVVPNNYREIIRVLRETKSDVLVFIGGTGVSPRDITVDVLEEFSWRSLPGFGEVFRSISIQRVGLRAIMSRASLFILPDARVAAALPGSKEAVEVGMDILLSIVEHVVEEARRIEGEHKIRS